MSKSASKFRFWIPLLITVGVSGAIAFFAVKQGESLSHFKHAFSRFSGRSLAIALGFDLLQNFFMMLRLGFLIRRVDKNPSVTSVVKSIGWGQWVNSTFPARVGDLLKIGFLKKPSVSAVMVTGVIAADKVVDAVAFLLLILLTRAFMLPEFRDSSLLTDAFSAPFFLIVLIILFFLAWILWKKAALLRSKWLEFKKGFAGVMSLPIFIVATLIGVGVWGAEALALRQLIVAQGLSIGWGQVFFLFIALNVAIAVPVSVGNLGTFEAAIVGAMRLLGYPLSECIIVAVTHHLLQLIAVSGWASVGVVMHFIEKNREIEKKANNGVKE